MILDDRVVLRCVSSGQLLVTVSTQPPALTVSREMPQQSVPGIPVTRGWARASGQASRSKRRQCGVALRVPTSSERGYHIPGGEAVRVWVTRAVCASLLQIPYDDVTARDSTSQKAQWAEAG